MAFFLSALFFPSSSNLFPFHLCQWLCIEKHESEAKPWAPPGEALRLSLSFSMWHDVQRLLRFSAQLKAKCFGWFTVMAVSFAALGHESGSGHRHRKDFGLCCWRITSLQWLYSHLLLGDNSHGVALELCHSVWGLSGGCDKYTSVIDQGIKKRSVFFVWIQKTLVYNWLSETAAKTLWQHLLSYNSAWVYACVLVEGGPIIQGRRVTTGVMGVFLTDDLTFSLSLAVYWVWIVTGKEIWLFEVISLQLVHDLHPV